MPSKLRLSREYITEAMQSEGVRGELKKKADALAQRANQIGVGEDVEMEATVAEGTRPQGRPFARVESPRVGQEWGNRDFARRRILGRTAEGA